MRGVRTKTRAVFQNVASSHYVVFVRTETWLSGQHFSNELFPNRFDVVRFDRRSAIGGGVLIAINKNAIKSEEVVLTDDEDLEYVCVKLSGGNKCLFIYAFYIPPNSAVDTYQKHTESIDSIQMANMDALIDSCWRCQCA